MRRFYAALALFFSLPAAAMIDSSPVPSLLDQPFAPIVLDPGHGGDDMGAVIKGVKEKDLALLFARKLRDRLKGLPVVLTRDDDRYVTLDQRVIGAMDRRATAFVSIHFNQVKSKKLSGAAVYSYGPELRHAWRPKRLLPSVPMMPAPPKTAARESAALAQSIVRAMRKGGYRVEPAKADYYVLKNPALPSVLVELGYLTNPEERERLVDPAYQDRLIDVLAKALESFVGDRSLRVQTAAVPAVSGR